MMKKYQVLWEYIVGETNMVWLVEVTDYFKLVYLYHKISSTAIGIHMLEAVFSGVREESL